jgi:putative transposase
MLEGRRSYPPDLMDREWPQVSRYIPTPKPGGRPAKHERREIVNAQLYVARAGCQWRALPHDFPPWDAVYWCFRTGTKDGTLDRLHDERRAEGCLRRAVDQDGGKQGPQGYDGVKLLFERTSRRFSRAQSGMGRRGR